VAEHDHDDEPASPNSVMPEGSVMFAVTGPVAAEPGSDTSTVTSAVTPRLSRPVTWTETLSLAFAETVGVGVGVGDALGEADGDADGEADGLGVPVPEVDGVGLGGRDDDLDGLGEAVVVADGVAEAPGVADRFGRLVGNWPADRAGPCRFVTPGTTMAPTCPRGGCGKYTLGTAIDAAATAVATEAIGWWVINSVTRRETSRTPRRPACA
jgi:hypothetical protein